MMGLEMELNEGKGACVLLFLEEKPMISPERDEEIFLSTYYLGVVQWWLADRGSGSARKTISAQRSRKKLCHVVFEHARPVM
jgi:hypothetical protein